jgi:hypothetical protein
LGADRFELACGTDSRAFGSVGIDLAAGGSPPTSINSCCAMPRSTTTIGPGEGSVATSSRLHQTPVVSSSARRRVATPATRRPSRSLRTLPHRANRLHDRPWRPSPPHLQHLVPSLRPLDQLTAVARPRNPCVVLGHLTRAFGQVYDAHRPPAKFPKMVTARYWAGVPYVVNIIHAVLVVFQRPRNYSSACRRRVGRN